MRPGLEGPGREEFNMIYLELSNGTERICDRGMGGEDIVSSRIYGPFSTIHQSYNTIEVDGDVELDIYDDYVYYDGLLFSDRLFYAGSGQQKRDLETEKAHAEVLRVEIGVAAGMVASSTDEDIRIEDIEFAVSAGHKDRLGRILRHLIGFPVDNIELDDEDMILRR